MASATENRYVNLYINGKQAGKTLSEIRQNQRRLAAEINRGTLSQKEYNTKVKELQQYNSVLRKHQDNVRGINRQWSQLKTMATAVVGANLITGAIEKIGAFIPNMIRMNAQLADSYADVRKTTNLTAEGMDDLAGRFRSFDTRTARSELLQMARDAGKLGIEGVNNLEGFVRAADQITVALGADLGEGAIRQLGKLNNLFKTSEVYGFEQGMLKLGSVINELGMNSEAMEGNIVDFTSRLAGVATQADISFESIAAMGATLDALGQRIETSGTAISQSIVGMFRDTETFAGIAGKSVEDFSKILETDANEAFITVLEGLNGNNEGLSVMIEKFDEMGLNGNRAITVLASLAGNTEKLREQQEFANKAFREGTSVTKEFNLKNENAAAFLAHIQRALVRLWINSDLMNGITKVTRALADMVKVPVSKTLENQRMRFNGLMSALQDVNLAEEARLSIIKQLQESFPERIGNLNLEVATIEELAAVQALANKQFLIEIAIQSQKEAIMAKARDINDRIIRQAQTQEQAGRALLAVNESLGTSYGTTAEAVADLETKAKFYYDQGLKRNVAINEEATQLLKLRTAVSDVNLANAKFAGTNREVEQAQADQLSMIEQLKKNYPELADVIDETNARINGQATGQAVSGGTPSLDAEPTAPGATPVDEKALEEARKAYEKLVQDLIKEDEKLQASRLEGYARERMQLDAHYEGLRAQAEGHNEELLLIESLYEEARDQLDDKYRMEREAAMQEISLATMSDFDREVAEMEAHYNELILLAQEFALDISGIEEAKNRALAALRQKHIADATADAQRLAAQQAAIAFEGAGHVIDSFRMVADAQGKNAAFQADMMMFMQLANAGMALSNAAASAKGITPADYLAGLAAVIAAVSTRIAAARAISEQAGSVPEPPQFATGTMGYLGGEFVAGEAGREIVRPTQVLPAAVSQDIFAANAFSRSMPQPNFSSINSGLTWNQSAQNQATSPFGATDTTMDLGPMISEIRAMRQDLRTAQSKRVYLVDKDREDFDRRRDENAGRVRMRK